MMNLKKLFFHQFDVIWIIFFLYIYLVFNFNFWIIYKCFHIIYVIKLINLFKKKKQNRHSNIENIIFFYYIYIIYESFLKIKSNKMKIMKNELIKINHHYSLISFCLIDISYFLRNKKFLCIFQWNSFWFILKNKN